MCRFNHHMRMLSILNMRVLNIRKRDMNSLTLPVGTRNGFLWLFTVAIVLLLISFNVSRIAAWVYRNLAVQSLSTALVTNQPRVLLSAEAYAKEAARYNGHSLGMLAYRLGIAKQQLGLPDEAFVHFQEALQADKLPESVRADLLLRSGLYYMNKGMVEEAIGHFRRLLELEITEIPAETAAHANVYLGRLLGQQSGDPLLERVYLERAVGLVLDPLTMDSYLALITQLRERGGEEYLQQALEMAIYATERQPSSPWTALARCTVYLSRGELADATSWCRRARDLAPNNHHTRVWLGLTYARQELWEEALVEYEIAASLTSDNSWYLSLAAEARAKAAGE